jgi:hypothetical protein
MMFRVTGVCANPKIVGSAGVGCGKTESLAVATLYLLRNVEKIIKNSTVKVKSKMNQL